MRGNEQHPYQRFVFGDCQRVHDEPGVSLKTTHIGSKGHIIDGETTFYQRVDISAWMGAQPCGLSSGCKSNITTRRNAARHASDSNVSKRFWMAHGQDDGEGLNIHLTRLRTHRQEHQDEAQRWHGGRERRRLFSTLTGSIVVEKSTGNTAWPACPIRTECIMRMRREERASLFTSVCVIHNDDEEFLCPYLPIAAELVS